MNIKIKPHFSIFRERRINQIRTAYFKEKSISHKEALRLFPKPNFNKLQEMSIILDILEVIEKDPEGTGALTRKLAKSFHYIYNRENLEFEDEESFFEQIKGRIEDPRATKNKTIKENFKKLIVSKGLENRFWFILKKVSDILKN